VAARDAFGYSGQAFEALPLVLEIIRSTYQHTMLNVVVNACENGAGQTLTIAAQLPGQDASFTNLLELLAQ
jgi:hypothetical protein